MIEVDEGDRNDDGSVDGDNVGTNGSNDGDSSNKHDGGNDYLCFIDFGDDIIQCRINFINMEQWLFIDLH